MNTLRNNLFQTNLSQTIAHYNILLVSYPLILSYILKIDFSHLSVPSQEKKGQNSFFETCENK